MQNIIRTELTDATCVTASPEITLKQDLARMIVANELIQNEIVLRDKDFMHAYDEYLEKKGYPKYGDLENQVSDLRHKLFKLTEEIEEYKARVEYFRSRR